MAKSISLSKDTRPEIANGNEDANVGFSWGTNNSRFSITRNYVLKHNGEVVGNSMKVTQQGRALEITPNEQDLDVVAGQTISISGQANGKYIRYSTPLSGLLQVVSAIERSEGPASSNSFGTWDTLVKNYGNFYDYSLSVKVPQNAAGTTQYLNVLTYDKTNSTDIKLAEFSLSVSNSDEGGGGGDTPTPEYSPTISSIELRLQGTNVNPLRVGDTATVLITLYSPSGITNQDELTNYVRDITFSSSYSRISIARIEGNPRLLSVTALSQGEGAGGDVLTVRVTDTSSNTVTSTLPISIKEAGSITVQQETTIRSKDTSVECDITLVNIDISKGFQFTNTNGASWIGSLIYNSSAFIDTSRNKLIITGVRENNSSANRTAAIAVTGTDIFGTIKTSNTFNIVQEYNSVYPCDRMIMSGFTSVFNSNNRAIYTINYDPDNTTEKDCIWKLTDSSNNVISITDGSGNITNNNSSIASLSTVTDFEVTLNVGSGAATNTALTLTAIHQKNGADDPSITVSKNITIRYYVVPEIVIGNITGSAVSKSYYDTSDDTPRISFKNSEFNGSILIVSDDDNMFDTSVNPYLVDTGTTDQYGKVYKLVVALNQNTTHDDKQGSIEIHATDPENTDVPATIQYQQLGVPVASSRFEVSNIANVGVISSGYTTSLLNFKVDWINYATGSVTFQEPTWTLTVYDDNDDSLFTQTGSLSSVTVGTVYPNVSTDNYTDITLSQNIDVYEYLILELRCGNISGTAVYDSRTGSSWVDDN